MNTTGSAEPVVIKTSRGEFTVNAGDIIHFPEGLIGFEQFTDFAVFDLKECRPFKTMLSVQEGGPDFVVLEPLEIFEDYAACVLDVLGGQPELGSPWDLALLSIVTLSDRPEDITVNLRGPIFMNRKTRTAKQVVIADDKYRTKMPLLSRY